MNPAQHSRLQKERLPERYCSHPRCLWNTARSGQCPKHPVVRTLPPRAFDALKLAAEQFGGIGHALMYEDLNHLPEKEDCSDSPPLNVWGLMQYAFGYCFHEATAADRKEAAQEAFKTLMSVGLVSYKADLAVRRIIKLRNIPDGPDDPFPRVTFEDYCAELGIKRGMEITR